MHHFGSGLVRTPSDFGLRSEPPTHPELLDDLATQFVASGWSIKALHRLILNSSVYQQRSDGTPEGLAVDPQNLLLWRQNRRRLDFEAMRDGVLAVAGNLDPTMGGRPVELFDRNVAAAREAITNLKDGDVHTPWSLLRGGTPIFTMPRSHVVRTVILNHLMHHRAHLCVYHRLNDVPVPGMYGPSGDE